MERQKSESQNKSQKNATNITRKLSELNASNKFKQPNKAELEKEPDSDIDPSMIFDPIKR